MPKLDDHPEVRAIARALEVPATDSAVAAIVYFCRQKIQGWLNENGGLPPQSIGELEEFVCKKLGLVIEEFRTDEELEALCQKYLSQGEFVFAAIKDDFDHETFATLFERTSVGKKLSRRFVAVVDCRGEKLFRRFFTRWHEIAHLLSLGQQLELGLQHRSRGEQTPSERLMDTIAADVGFFPSLFDPLLNRFLEEEGRLSFSVAQKVRDNFCVDASFAATFNACHNRYKKPSVILECRLNFKKKERELVESSQTTLFDERMPKPKLRILSARPNDAAKKLMNFHNNMEVPATSSIHKAFNALDDLTIYSGEENLSNWTHSDGKAIGNFPIYVEARKQGDKVIALVTSC